MNCIRSNLSRIALAAGLLALCCGAARAADAAAPEATSALPAQAQPPVLTRAEVIAQVIAARRSGELDVLTTEDSGSFYLSRHGYRALQMPDANLASATRR